MTSFPIPDAPGQWGDPPGYTVSADDMYRRVDVPLNQLYASLNTAQGVALQFSGSKSVPNGGAGPTNIVPSSVTEYGAGSSSNFRVDPTALKIMSDGLYMIATQFEIDAPWSGRCFADVVKYNYGFQRQPAVANGWEQGLAHVAVVQVSYQQDVQWQLYQSTGATRTGTISGVIWRLFAGSV